MSNQITDALVRQYASNVTMLYQQNGSVLRGKVREQRVNARYAFFERIGPTAMVEKTVRHGDTPLVNTPHSRRRVEMKDYEWGDMIDKQDQVRILIEPQSAYAQNAAMALGRQYDSTIITAFTAQAFEGETGGTAVPFPTGTQQIVNGSTGLTVAKLQESALIHDNADVPRDSRMALISPEGVQDLLTDPQVTSSDFSTMSALMVGTIENMTYMGYQFSKTTLLPIASNIRSCFTWHRDSMGVAMGMDFTTRVSERSDKSYATQVYVAATFGAIRIQDPGVVQIDIDESV